MKRSRSTTFAFALLVCLGACTHKLTVRAPVTLPARAPVFVFPSVWVAGGDSEEEAYLLDRIAADLAREPRREVRRVDDADLEPAREAGQILVADGGRAAEALVSYRSSPLPAGHARPVLRHVGLRDDELSELLFRGAGARG